MAKEWLEYLTSEEIAELKYEVLNSNYKRYLEFNTNRFNLDIMLDWGKTRKGRHYWSDLHEKLQDINISYGFTKEEYRMFIETLKIHTRYIKEPKNVKDL